MCELCTTTLEGVSNYNICSLKKGNENAMKSPLKGQDKSEPFKSGPSSLRECMQNFKPLTFSLLAVTIALVAQLTVLNAFAVAPCLKIHAEFSKTTLERTDSADLHTDIQELHLPRELKLREEDLPFLLNQTRHQPLIRALGKVFYVAEAHPKLYDELAHLLSQPAAPDHFGRHEPAEFRQNWQRFNLGEPSAKEYQTVLELFDRITKDLDQYSFSEQEAFLLAYLGRSKVNMASEILTKSFDSSLAGSNKQNPTVAQNHPYLRLINDRSTSLARSEAFFQFAESIVESLKTSVPSSQSEVLHWNLKTTTGPLKNVTITRHSFSDPHLGPLIQQSLRNATRKTQRELYSFVATYELYQVLLFAKSDSLKWWQRWRDMSELWDKSEHKSASQIRAEKNALLNAVEHRLLDEYKTVSTRDEVMNILDYLFFGANLIESADVIRQHLLDSARTATLSAKNEVAAYRTSIQAEETKKRLESQRPLQIDYRLAREQVEPQSRGPKKRSVAPETLSTSTLPTNHLSASKAPINRDSLEFLWTNPNEKLVANTEYTFVFLRLPHLGPQRVRFSDEVVSELNRRPTEQRKFLRALNLGFTDRSSQGVPGIKLLWKKGQDNADLYEVKPGDSSFRLLMQKVNGTFEVHSFVAKSHKKRF